MKFCKYYILSLLLLLTTSGGCFNSKFNSRSRLNSEFDLEKARGDHAVDIIYDLSGQNESLLQEKINLEKDRDQLTIENEKLKQFIENLENKIKELERLLENEKQKNTRNDEAKENDQQEELDELKKQIAELRNQIAGIITAINQTTIPQVYIQKDLVQEHAINQIHEIGELFHKDFSIINNYNFDTSPNENNIINENLKKIIIKIQKELKDKNEKIKNLEDLSNLSDDEESKKINELNKCKTILEEIIKNTNNQKEKLELSDNKAITKDNIEEVVNKVYIKQIDLIKQEKEAKDKIKSEIENKNNRNTIFKTEMSIEVVNTDKKSLPICIDELIKHFNNLLNTKDATLDDEINKLKAKNLNLENLLKNLIGKINKVLTKLGYENKDILEFNNTDSIKNLQKLEDLSGDINQSLIELNKFDIIKSTSLIDADVKCEFLRKVNKLIKVYKPGLLNAIYNSDLFEKNKPNETVEDYINKQNYVSNFNDLKLNIEYLQNLIKSPYTKTTQPSWVSPILQNAANEISRLKNENNTLKTTNNNPNPISSNFDNKCKDLISALADSKICEKISSISGVDDIIKILNGPPQGGAKNLKNQVEQFNGLVKNVDFGKLKISAPTSSSSEVLEKACAYIEWLKDNQKIEGNLPYYAVADMADLLQILNTKTYEYYEALDKIIKALNSTKVLDLRKSVEKAMIKYKKTNDDNFCVKKLNAFNQDKVDRYNSISPPDSDKYPTYIVEFKPIFAPLLKNGVCEFSSFYNRLVLGKNGGGNQFKFTRSGKSDTNESLKNNKK